MNILISIGFLAALVGVITWIKARGWFRYTGCTCRKGEPCEHRDKGA
jgi:hypothetical protein